MPPPRAPSAACVLCGVFSLVFLGPALGESLATPGAISWQPGGPVECTSLSAASHMTVDSKVLPALGVSAAPVFAWAVPSTLLAVDAARVQVFDGALGNGSSALVWDSGFVAGAVWSVLYGGPALAAGHPYAFRVALQPGGEAWSALGVFVTGLWSSGWSPSIEPVWASNASAQFVLLRSVVSLPAPPPAPARVVAYAFVTANPQESFPDGENGKLLGAYKLSVGGALVGLGPGRPGRCGPKCPLAGSPGPCTCVPEQLYDVLDVTDAVVASLNGGNGNGNGGGSEVVFALQCYHAPGPEDAQTARVLLQVHVFFGREDGAPLVFGTSPTAAWEALDATAWMQPTCCTETQWFFAPAENWDARREPVGWKTNGSTFGWPAPVAVGAFFAPLGHRPTLSLSVRESIAPAVALLLAPGHLFVDLGREIQGGLTLAFPPDTREGDTFLVQEGEELLSASPPAVMFDMRTGNTYSASFTTRGGAQVIEMHEYIEFRYAQILWDGGSSPPPTCLKTASGDYTTPVNLTCAGPGNAIESFSFASWGTPDGECTSDGGDSFAVNASCAYNGTARVLDGLCLGRPSCAFTPSDGLFGNADPCHYTDKWLAVAWTCAAPPPQPPSPPSSPPNVSAWQVFYPSRFVGDAAAACEGGAAGTGAPGGSAQSEGLFASSSDALNVIASLCEYTVRATAIDLMTDSNTRQRSPICAEAVLTTNLLQSAASYETASQAYTTAYILNGSPGGAGWAEWQSLLISSVWTLWQSSGDLSMFIEHAPLLRRFLELELLNATNGLWTCSTTNGSTAEAGVAPLELEGAPGALHFGPGPWSCLQPEIDWPSGMRDGFVFVPANTVVNAHLVGALAQYGDLAEAAGNATDAQMARALSDAVAQAMMRLLYNETAGAMVDGLTTAHAAIHSSVYTLGRGVADGNAAIGAALWSRLLERLDPVAGIPTGPYPGLFYGEALFRNVSDHGRAAVASFLLNNGTNSFNNMLRQGATTTMEAWTPAEKPNLTWSHPWMAFPLQLITRWLLGVQAFFGGGAASLRVLPQLGPLTWAVGTVPTIRGPVAVAVNQTLDATSGLPATFAMNLTLPGAMQALVCLPASACTGSLVLLDGKVIAASDSLVVSYACLANVTAGVHQLACPAAGSVV